MNFVWNDKRGLMSAKRAYFKVDTTESILVPDLAMVAAGAGTPSSVGDRAPAALHVGARWGRVARHAIHGALLAGRRHDRYAHLSGCGGVLAACELAAAKYVGRWNDACRPGDGIYRIQRVVQRLSNPILGLFRSHAFDLRDRCHTAAAMAGRAQRHARVDTAHPNRAELAEIANRPFAHLFITRCQGGGRWHGHGARHDESPSASATVKLGMVSRSTGGDICFTTDI